ncbi:MAG: MdtA/MuxA family multidrug efflux RND transporter periplasmic adaptor subunit [Terriglobales bacterium]
MVAVLVFVGWHYRPAPARTAAAAGGRGRGGAAAAGRGGAAAAVPVGVAVARSLAIPVYLRGIGTVTPANTVTLQSRVDGQIMAVHFQEGQMVHKGELLVEIDPRPYQAALAQAQGALARDTAILKNDQIDLDRYQSLFQQNIISRQQLDAQAALVAQYQGSISSDQAAIDTAKLNVQYARITAPIDGRIGLRQVDPGNIVHANSSTGLAVITQVQPIAVLFNLPQVDLPQVTSELNAGHHPEVAVLDSTNTKQLASGRLLTIDNAIDPTTGTFRCKALFDNRDNALFPSQFVNARMTMGQATGLAVVPPAAVQRGPQGTYVFVVNPNHTVTAHDVNVQITEGAEAGLSSGVQPGDTVVVDGADKLQDGTRVEIAGEKPQPAAAPTPGAKPGRSGRGGRGRGAAGAGGSH